ncbi:hypothetical protein [Nocardiopsis synnemataformans]
MGSFEKLVHHFAVFDSDCALLDDRVLAGGKDAPLVVGTGEDRTCV